jgi:hypothetical protein
MKSAGASEFDNVAAFSWAPASEIRLARQRQTNKEPRAAEQGLRQGFDGQRAVTIAVIPGCATWRRPGIHIPCVGVWMLNVNTGVMDSGLARSATKLT